MLLAPFVLGFDVAILVAMAALMVEIKRTHREIVPVKDIGSTTECP